MFEHTAIPVITCHGHDRCHIPTEFAPIRLVFEAEVGVTITLYHAELRPYPNLRVDVRSIDKWSTWHANGGETVLPSVNLTTSTSGQLGGASSNIDCGQCCHGECGLKGQTLGTPTVNLA